MLQKRLQNKGKNSVEQESLPGFKKVIHKMINSYMNLNEATETQGKNIVQTFRFKNNL